MEICHTEATAIMTTSLHRRKCPVQGKQGKYELALRSYESVSRVTEMRLITNVAAREIIVLPACYFVIISHQ